MYLLWDILTNNRWFLDRKTSWKKSIITHLADSLKTFLQPPDSLLRIKIVSFRPIKRNRKLYTKIRIPADPLVASKRWWPWIKWPESNSRKTRQLKVYIDFKSKNLNARLQHQWPPLSHRWLSSRTNRRCCRNRNSRWSPGNRGPIIKKWSEKREVPTKISVSPNSWHKFLMHLFFNFFDKAGLLFFLDNHSEILSK